VAEHKVPESRIDDAVRRILRIKLQMGSLKILAPIRPDRGNRLRAHREVARECVRESLVLLKNDATPAVAKNLKHLVVVAGPLMTLASNAAAGRLAGRGKPGKPPMVARRSWRRLRRRWRLHRSHVFT